MSCSENAISLRNLKKSFRLFGRPSDRLMQALSFGLKSYHREYTALQGISLNIKKGESIGIIGRNGSGKSTLLQLICGILKPTAGTLEVRGKVAALLELGAGFNPEFTGRENVYFQGAIQGFSQEAMDERIDAIAAFAEIGEFLDQPVRMYSSGMYVRLAFAAAIHVSPDILVIDEALAVGDSAFQEKCLQHIRRIQEGGTTILLVSHAMEQIAHYCQKVALLDRGRLVAYGEPAAVLNQYLGLQRPQAISLAAGDDGLASHPSYNPRETRWGDRAVSIDNITLFQGGHQNAPTLSPGGRLSVHIDVTFHDATGQLVAGLVIKTPEGGIVLNTNSQSCHREMPSCAPGERLSIGFNISLHLPPGDYLLSVGIASQENGNLIPHDRRYDCLHLTLAAPRLNSGEIDFDPEFEIFG